MINKKFKEDWIHFLKINNRINQSEDPKEIKELIKIPFTPIEVDAHLLYFLSYNIYPKFINDQKNVVDIIISDYDIENITLAAYLHKTTKLGIFDAVEELSSDMIKFAQKDLNNLEKLFIDIQTKILKSKNIRIASLRFYRRRGIDLINRYYEEINKYSNIDFIKKLLDLIEKLIKDDLVKIYPEPNILIFLKSVFKSIKNINLSSIFQLILDLIPNFNHTIIFHSKSKDFLINCQKYISKQTKNTLQFALKSLDLDEDPIKFNSNKKNLNKIEKKFKSDNLIVLRFDSMMNLLLEFSELKVPIEKEKLKLLFQKLLFAFNCIGIHWNITQRPKLYNSLVRFLIRMLGLNLNLKKVSYWAIPEFIYALSDRYLGLDYKIIVILTDNDKFEVTLSIEFQNGELNKIIQIDQNKILKPGDKKSLSSVWSRVNNTYGYHKVIIKINKKLIQKILETLLFKFNKLSILSAFSIIRMTKNSKIFEVFPEIAPFQIIKKKNSFSLLKILFNVFIDKFEF